MTKVYKQAFRCNKCPQNNGEQGCPMWWETLWEQPGSGQQQFLKGCGYQQLPLYLIEVVKASNRPVASLDKLSNLMNNHLINMCAAVSKALEVMVVGKQLPGNGKDDAQKELFDGR